MSRRRVRLGSRLDPHKLAGTIRQIAVSDPPPPALICHLAGREDAWVHLAADMAATEGDALPTISEWKLTLGYPLKIEPSTAFAQASIPLPEGAKTDSWEAGIYAVISLPSEISPEELANLAAAIFRNIQQAEAADDVEIALEYE